MQIDFWQFSKNADRRIIPGKLSKIYLHAWLFSNPCGKVLFLLKSYHGLENNHACKWASDNLHAWLFSNPCGQVLIIVGISWSPDLRVQHILYTIHYSIFTIQYTLYTIHYRLYTINIHYTLYTTLYTLHFTLYTIHYTRDTQYTWYTQYT